MAKYLVILHAPGITLEQFGESAREIVKNEHATFVHAYANLVDGTIVNIYEAETADQVELEMERLGWPFDEIAKIQYETSLADLTANV
ncbi:hypothetical protein ACQPZQ_31100 [Pseudonocardia sp. CA-142604]|uniref:hypothetical protein n=1 Tax=Pseudonocardia sp. CA-142604 TaxID=3240024 RepID=UPI003D8CB312